VIGGFAARLGGRGQHRDYPRQHRCAGCPRGEAADHGSVAAAPRNAADGERYARFFAPPSAEDLTVAAADSSRAIGAVTRLLRDHLIRRGIEVSIGKPEAAAQVNTPDAKLNLFLYEIGFDPHLRNVELRRGDPPPLWLVLKYLLTAFDSAEDSDSADAHELLGRGIAALQEMSLLRLVPPVIPSVQAALQDNPEALKLSFDETTSELLSKIMQGTDERYRLSMAFQVRPVMIVPAAPSGSSLLVGIDYTSDPQTVIGEDGVVIDVIPSLGPVLDRIVPAAFAAGAEVEVFGDELHGANIEVVLGDQLLTILERRSDRLLLSVEGTPPAPIADGSTLSAGEHALVARRRLSPTRVRSSNVQLAKLLPTVASAALVGADLRINGTLLGRGPLESGTDDVVVALFRDGRAARLFDVVADSSNQNQLIIPAVTAAGLPAGEYRVIVKVNNQQARFSPPVVLP
jgi:Pvc16 N-terminal domain